MKIERLTSEEQSLRRMADELREKHGCLGVKMSTEDAGDSFDVINVVANKILADSLPLYVKIGGPNARGDIKKVYELGLSGTVAPMVESPYSVRVYVEALKAIIPQDVLTHMLRGLNAESIACYETLDEMLKIPESKELNHVTVGTGDLAKSMGKRRDDPDVIEVARKMVEKLKAKGIPVSVSVTSPENAKALVKEIKPDKINSSSVYLNVHKVRDVYESFKQALIFETAIIQYRYSLANNEALSYQKMIEAWKAKTAK